MPDLRNRGALAKHFSDRGFRVGAEIGVFAGDYSMVLWKHMPKLRLYGVDNWKSNNWKKGMDLCIERYTKNGGVLIHSDSVSAANFIEDKSLDFVYIDASHYFDDVIMDLITWSKKVKKGGVISGHDYERGNGYKSRRDGVREAVEVYARCHKYKVNLTQERLSEPSSWWMRKRWN